MKAWWLAQEARINALSLRERVFLLLSLLAVLLAVVDTLWLTPTQSQLKQAKLQFSTQSVELQRLRDELQASGQPVDPSQAVRADLARAQARLDAVNQRIHTDIPLAQSQEGLEQVLVAFLRRQEGLTLISTGTVAQPGEAEAAAGSAAPLAAQPAGLLRRGLELKVAGPYVALVRYVQSLETALPALRWGNLQLVREGERAVLTVQVFVLGVQP